MKIVIINIGSLPQNLVSSSLIRGIEKKDKNYSISMVLSEEHQYIYKYNKKIKKCYSLDSFIRTEKEYDVLINLSPFFIPYKYNTIKYHYKIGFNCGVLEIEDCFKEILLNNQLTTMNLFQFYYKLAGLVWRGEGYDLGYYPKTRSKANKVGISIANANLRNYVLEKLISEKYRIWVVPYKKNIFKKMDEINKCMNIITDDMTTFHLSMYLRKYVYFLKTFSWNFEMEMFGQGEICDVPLINISP